MYKHTHHFNCNILILILLVRLFYFRFLVFFLIMIESCLYLLMAPTIVSVWCQFSIFAPSIVMYQAHTPFLIVTFFI